MKILRSRIRLLSFVLSVLFLVILLVGTRAFWQDAVPSLASPSPSPEEPAESPSPEPQYVTFGL